MRRLRLGLRLGLTVVITLGLYGGLRGLWDSAGQGPGWGLLLVLPLLVLFAWSMATGLLPPPEEE